MMIFGSATKPLRTIAINAACHNCGGERLHAHVFQKYFHLYWIPTFPVGKQVAIECVHCRIVYRETDLPKKSRQDFSPIKKAAQTPLWMFTGIFLVAVLCGLAYFSQPHGT